MKFGVANIGMMEYWKNGRMKPTEGSSPEAIMEERRIGFLKANCFQQPIIPTFHYSKRYT